MGDHSGPADKHWAVRSVTWLRLNWPPLATLSGAVAYALSGASAAFMSKPDESNGLAAGMFWAGTALTTVGGVVGLSRGPKLAGLERNAEQSEHDADEAAISLHKVMSGMLAEILRGLDLYSATSRASLYSFENDSFYILGRSSQNPELRAKGRSVYPKGQGVIGRAWTDGQKIVHGLPLQRAAWNTRMKDYDISPEVASNLKMQCRSIVAKRVEQGGPGGTVPVAIVVFESTLPSEMTAAILDMLPTMPEWKMLEAAVVSSRETLPRVARRAGEKADERAFASTPVTHRAKARAAKIVS